MYKIQQKQGFTLIELLVVIAIIGILSAIGITALANSQSKARDAKRRSDLHAIGSSLSGYLDDHTSYPIAYPDVAQAPADQGPAWTSETTSSFSIGLTADGIAIPRSPKMGSSGTSIDYWYLSDAAGLMYALLTKLETNGEWFVYNSKGWANTIDGSDSITDAPTLATTECVDDFVSKTFSPCLSQPRIQ